MKCHIHAAIVFLLLPIVFGITADFVGRALQPVVAAGVSIAFCRRERLTVSTELTKSSAGELSTTYRP